MAFLPALDQSSRRVAAVESLLADPKAFAVPQRAQELSKESARLKDLVPEGRAYLKVAADLAESRQILAGEPEDPELVALAREDIARLEKEEKRLQQAVYLGIVTPDPTDSRNTIVEIRSGAGGAE